MSLQAKYIN